MLFVHFGAPHVRRARAPLRSTPSTTSPHFWRSSACSPRSTVGARDGAKVGTPAWEREFDCWLAPFWSALGDGRRERWGPVYVRGLLGPGDRKSIEPLVARVAPDGYAQVHHFVCTSCWDPAPLERVLAEKAQGMVGGPDHHALMTMISFAFLQHLRLREIARARRRGENGVGGRRTAATVAAGDPTHAPRSHSGHPFAMPEMQRAVGLSAARVDVAK